MIRRTCVLATCSPAVDLSIRDTLAQDDDEARGRVKRGSES